TMQAPAGVRKQLYGTGGEDGESLPAGTESSQPARVALIDAAGRVRARYRDLSGPEQERIISDMNRLQAGQVEVPERLFETRIQLAARAERQQQTAEELTVFHDFRLTDGLPASGITFRHHIVADAGKDYEAAHYDHGNGLAVADVDGDGLVDLYFLTQAGSNELWRNLGGGRFENITETAGVSLADRISVSAAFGDIDNDGDADLFVTTVRFGNVLFLNDGTGGFRDITEEAGVGHTGHSSGAVFFDYDRDGLLDLFVTNVGQYTTGEMRHTTTEAVRGTPLEYSYYEAHSDAFAGHLQAEQRNERSILYHNLGEGRFADVTEAMNIVDTGWSGDATPLDANGDGWIDLYVLNMQGHDEYYENVEGQRFEKKSAERFPATPWGSMGARVFDYNGDGRFDLFLTDMHSDMSTEVGAPLEKLKATMNWPPRLVQSGQFNPQPGRTSIYGNALFQAAEDGRFSDVSDATGAENYWPWGLSTGDLNADGWEDVFITASMNYPFRYGINSLLLNVEGQRFHDSEFLLGVEPRPDGQLVVPWFELDSSGDDAPHRLTQERQLSGKRVVWSAAGSRSSVMIDLDGDGDLDILTSEFNTRPQLLLSNLSQQKPELSWLKIQLQGTQSNRDGLGAVVRVHIGERVLSQVYDGCSGYLSHSLFPLYFGLGGAREADRIEVVWPSGQQQTLDGPHAAGQTLNIEEPATSTDSEPAP
ncbi:MAG: CRTAC1 family protein, partial [Planctomycetaceae bacterium]|nr:CRTAC1 family protein [Planctomycetaceae bacterium]